MTLLQALEFVAEFVITELYGCGRSSDCEAEKSGFRCKL